MFVLHCWLVLYCNGQYKKSCSLRIQTVHVVTQVVNFPSMNVKMLIVRSVTSSVVDKHATLRLEHQAIEQLDRKLSEVL